MKKQVKKLVAIVEAIVMVVTLLTGITIVNTAEIFAEESEISANEDISKYDEVNMFTSNWNSWFGMDIGWYEAAEGELTSQSITSWIADMDTIGWGGIWGAQIYQSGTLSIQEGLEYTLKCSLLSEDCDKAVFIGIMSGDMFQTGGTYAYGKWIKLERGITTQIDETFTALADVDSIYIGLGGEFGDREGIDADGSIRYSFAEGGIENYVDTDPTVATKIECKNMVLGLTSEIEAIDNGETPTTDNSEIIQPTQPSTEQPTTTNTGGTATDEWRELTLNAGTEVSVEEREEKIYTFTAPKDGTYYFTVESENAPIWITVWKRSEECKYIGGSYVADLVSGQKCIISIYGDDDEEDGNYTSKPCVFVYDEIEANKYFAGLSNGKNSNYYLDVYYDIGESCTLKAFPVAMSGNVVDELPEGYTVKWEKRTNEGTFDLESDELEYTIDSLAESDFDVDYGPDYEYEDDDILVRYYCILYKDREEVDYISYSIYHKEDGYFTEDKAYFASSGESIILESELYDYEGKLVDLKDDTYSFEWYKKTPDGYSTDLSASTYTYEINQLEDVDFYYSWDNNCQFICKIYKNGKFIGEQIMHIYDKEKYIDICAPVEYEVTLGQKFEIEPIITDWEGNIIDAKSDRFEMEWAWYISNSSERKIMGYDNVCTLDSVSTEHIWGDTVLGYFECWIYDKEVDTWYRTEYYLINKGEGTTTNDKDNQTTTEKTATTQQPITVTKPTTKISVGTTKVKSATKKKAAKKAKISLKKVKGVTGYQIKISTSKKFPKKKTITKNSKKKVVTIKKLKAKKKYFVKARCYKVVNSKKYYGAWTKVKQVKMKK